MIVPREMEHNKQQQKERVKEMKVTETLSIVKRSGDNAFYGENNGVPYVIEVGHTNYPVYDSFYGIMRNTQFRDRPSKLMELMADGSYPEILGTMASPSVTPPKPKEEVLLEGVRKMMDFFSEFAFVPSFRFTNTFAFMANQGYIPAREYVHNYFALMDSSYVKEVTQKLESPEFKKIVDSFSQYGVPTSHINTRLKVYYGSAGTGKTTQAQKESDNRCIVCNSSMLPSDLMEDFIFRDGKPDFNPSLLWKCMENGEKIVLDELNLLPFDSLRFLQGIADGKTEFFYKNRPVHIKEGFQIIGTMNLSLGGMTYGLPEPLVDRCAEAKEYVLTAEQLAKAVVGMGGE